MEFLRFKSSKDTKALEIEIQLDVFKDSKNILNHVWYMWVHVDIETADGKLVRADTEIYREFENTHLYTAFKKVFTAAAISLQMSEHVDIVSYVDKVNSNLMYHQVYTYFMREVNPKTTLSAEEVSYLEPFVLWPPNQT
jgi:hypothetical protein